MDDGVQAAALPFKRGRHGEHVGVHAVHQQLGPDSQLHQGALLGAHRVLAAQVRDERRPPLVEGAGEGGRL